MKKGRKDRDTRIKSRVVPVTTYITASRTKKRKESKSIFPCDRLLVAGKLANQQAAGDRTRSPLGNL